MPVLTPTNQGLMRLALLGALTGVVLAAPGAAHAEVRSSVSGELLKVAGDSGSDRITVSCSASPTCCAASPIPFARCIVSIMLAASSRTCASTAAIRFPFVRKIGSP